MRTLVIPPAAQRNENSIQMISGWIAEKGLHCTLNIGMWGADGRNEPAAWGVLLADVIRHILPMRSRMQRAWTQPTLPVTFSRHYIQSSSLQLRMRSVNFTPAILKPPNPALQPTVLPLLRAVRSTPELIRWTSASLGVLRFRA